MAVNHPVGGSNPLPRAMSHYITKCDRDHIVSQCRCPSSNKIVRRVSSEQCPRCKELVAVAAPDDAVKSWFPGGIFHDGK
jgi:hypothetical protein